MKRLRRFADVTFLTQPRARFVSLVDRGANHFPWRVVKRRASLGEPMRHSLHKIIAPAGAPVATVMALAGTAPGFGRGLSPVRKGAYDCYQAAPAYAFVPGSFQLVDLDPAAGVRAVVGEPLTRKSGGVLARLFKVAEPAASGGQAPPKAVAPTEPTEPTVAAAQYAALLEDELAALVPALRAVLATPGDPEAPGERAEALAQTLEAFLALAEEALAALGEAAIPLAEAPSQPPAPVTPGPGTAPDAKPTAAQKALAERLDRLERSLPRIADRTSDHAADGHTARETDFTGCIFRR